VKRALAGLSSKVFVSRGGTEAPGDRTNKPAHYKGRDGYAATFLGRNHKVEMPGSGKWHDDLIHIKDADSGKKTTNIKYRHFSVVMSASRKLPVITAVNIDGTKSKKVGRSDVWYIDGRIPVDLQVDNEAYAKNALDRGHMVRREDPVWGELKQATEANADSFHYANCAPQHEALNQRDWVRLEDYILGSARAHKLQVSVFTGPILKERDRLYRGVVKLPEAFWKIAVMVDSKNKKLSATGYVLCQGELIKDISEAFVYGQFRTYQVPLSLVQDETGLELSKLLQFDPLGKRRKKEGLEVRRRLFFNQSARQRTSSYKHALIEPCLFSFSFDGLPR
jgi:endonuclease G, mitochondrial